MNLDRIDSGFAAVMQQVSETPTSTYGWQFSIPEYRFQGGFNPSQTLTSIISDRKQRKSDVDTYKNLYEQTKGLRGFNFDRFPDISNNTDPYDTSWLSQTLFPDIGSINEALEKAIASHDNIAGAVSEAKSKTEIPNPQMFTGRHDLISMKKAFHQQQKALRNRFKKDANGNDKIPFTKDEIRAMRELRRENRNAYRQAKTDMRANGLLPSGQDISKEINHGLVTPLMYGFKGANDYLMANKNFSNTARTANQAVDAAALGAAQIGSMFGGYGALIGGAIGLGLEAGKFGVYAGGKTVGGFDVANQSDSYGQALHHQDAQAFTAFTPSLMRGFNQNRAYEAQKAATASNISNQQHLINEAAENQAQYIIDRNKIALRGGMTNDRLRLLSARNGAKLESLRNFKNPGNCVAPNTVIVEEVSTILKAQNGAKLENVEVSDEKSVIPEGSLHKNKHEDFDLKVTPKGIPVITVANDNVQTLEEIQEQKDTLVQHAEIEHNEVIFSKELTDFIEECRKKWHDSDKDDDNICLEVGLRLTKELLMNTDDNTGLVEKLENQV